MLWYLAPLILAALTLPLLALFIYRWGYRAGVEAGKRELDAYRAGQAADGGCWVKQQPSQSIPPGPV
jgi:hypothetical protein